MGYSGFDAFVKGYRSTFLCVPKLCEEGYQYLMSQNTPYIEQREHIVFDDGDTFEKHIVWFFKDESLRQTFVTQSAQVEAGLKTESQFTGEMLGYPPMAIDFFTDQSEDKKVNQAFFEYHGITFAGHINDQQAIAEWLWENVPAPLAPVTVTYQKQSHTIEPIPVAI